MNQRRQRTIALLTATPTALVMVLSIGVLVTDYVRAVRRGPIDKQRIKVLEEAVKQDADQAFALRAELDRQTELSLERSATHQLTAKILITAAVLFLVSAKWLMSLKGRRPPKFDRLLLRQGIRSCRSQQTCSRQLADEAHPVAVRSEVDLAFVDEAIASHGRGRDAVIPILQAVQSHYRYLPQSALRCVCEQTEITPAQIAGVSSFYSQFRRTPVGEHVVKVCRGTACHVAGAETITDEIRRQLGIGPSEDTDLQQRFTIQEVACLGCCTLAPVVQVDQVTHGHLSPDAVAGMLNETLPIDGNGEDRSRARRATSAEQRGAAGGEIRVGLGSCCVAGGSGRVYETLERMVASTGTGVLVKRVGCVGMCHQTPLVEVALPDQPSSLYAGVRPEDVSTIVRRHIHPIGLKRRISRGIANVLDRIGRDAEDRTSCRSIEVRDPPIAAFLGRQKHIATEHCGHLDPADLDEYLRHDGFEALQRCVQQIAPQQVIDAIRLSGLRGRGGAGYPTGDKWSKVRNANADERCIVCNGDEGDPGAFMDRMLMESFPYRIIEGMAIAAYAVGAKEGYFYIRREYPLAVRRIREALDECRRRGFIGQNAPDGGIDLQLHVMEGAGAFVCGEETALIASIEGDRGSPRLRPPYPAEHGLHDKPTLVSNVETYASVPWIIRHGADAFSALGTTTSKGTKVFALTGKVNRGGLIEVPMGVTVREIVEEIGGGIKGGRAFKAVQIGGPSGGCIPATLADTPVDYEALSEAGAMMGSGGLVVLDDSDCVVDIARYMLSFTQDQSCGKCTYCRVGTRRMLDILDRLCEGQAQASDIDALEHLAHSVQGGSLCGLGKTAPNPVLTTLRYFREEYEAHLQGRCPAHKCKALITYHINDRCTGCTLCAQYCSAEAIGYTPYEKHTIDDEKCTRCDICRLKCPEDAITVE